MFFTIFIRENPSISPQQRPIFATQGSNRPTAILTSATFARVNLLAFLLPSLAVVVIFGGSPMSQGKNTESEEILEYRFSSEEYNESDFSYSEAVMDESIADFLNEEPPGSSRS